MQIELLTLPAPAYITPNTTPDSTVTRSANNSPETVQRDNPESRRRSLGAATPENGFITPPRKLSIPPEPAFNTRSASPGACMFKKKQ